MNRRLFFKPHASTYHPESASNPVCHRFSRCEGCPYREMKAGQMCSGPERFVSLLANADCVFTDSFHALSFALILNTPFFVYKRNYAHGIDQSPRVKALVEKMGMPQYLEPQAVEAAAWDFSNANSVIANERAKMLGYLCSCLHIPYQGEAFR